jgi:hypothetical protein
METAEAHLLLPAHVEHYWPAIAGELDKIRDQWEIWWTKEALKECAMDGRLQVWAIGSGDTIYLVAFAQVIYYPANKVMKIILLLGTRLDDFYDIAEATLEKFAKDQGCQYLETCGRPGWKRRCKGVHSHGVVLTRKLETTRVQ